MMAAITLEASVKRVHHTNRHTPGQPRTSAWLLKNDLEVTPKEYQNIYDGVGHAQVFEASLILSLLLSLQLAARESVQSLLKRSSIQRGVPSARSRTSVGANLEKTYGLRYVSSPLWYYHRNRTRSKRSNGLAISPQRHDLASMSPGESTIYSRLGLFCRRLPPRPNLQD